MYAIIKTGGKQYRVNVGDTLKVELLGQDAGSQVTFSEVLAVSGEEGLKVGMLRPITLWPFPTKAIAAYADKVKGILVTELNAGQMIEDVRLAVNGKVKVEHFGRLGGIVPDPDEIVEALAKLKIEG